MLLLELRNITLKGNCRMRTLTFKLIVPLIVSDRTLIFELFSYQLSTASTALRICTHLVKSVGRIYEKQTKEVELASYGTESTIPGLSRRILTSVR